MHQKEIGMRITPQKFLLTSIQSIFCAMFELTCKQQKTLNVFSKWNICLAYEGGFKHVSLRRCIRLKFNFIAEEYYLNLVE